MSGLKTATIGDIATFVGGGTPTRSNPDFYDGPIPWVTPKDMKSWEINSVQVTITQAGLEDSATRVVPSNSVLVVVRSGVLKHTIPVAVNRIPVAINQDMKALLCSNQVDAGYLARFIKAQSSVILKWVRATTADNFPVERLKQLAIPLPSLSEQRRIAAVLDQAAALRAKRCAALAQLDALTKALFLDMFGDPARNPKGWSIVPLGELAKIVRGASPRPKGDPRYFGGPIPWLMISDITAEPRKVVTRTKEGVTVAGRDRSVYLEPGTLVLTNSATVGVPKILGVGACIHDGFLAFLNIDERIEQDFLYMFFFLMRDYLTRLAPEGTQKNLNTRIAKGLRMIVPPVALQRAFALRAATVEELKITHSAFLAELDVLSAALEQRAFHGGLLN